MAGKRCTEPSEKLDLGHNLDWPRYTRKIDRMQDEMIETENIRKWGDGDQNITRIICGHKQTTSQHILVCPAAGPGQAHVKKMI